ncbi:MAG: hypothetical protein ACRDD2_11915 [Sarcina sp.]
MESLLSYFISIIVAMNALVGINDVNIIDLNNNFKKDYVVLEQGVQGKYLSENSIEKEIEILKEFFEIKDDFKIEGSTFSFSNKKDTIELNIFGVKEKKGTRVEVTIIKMNEKNQVETTINKIEKLNENMKTYSYLKNKINNLEVKENIKVLEKELNRLGFKDINTVEIDNGITGVAKKGKEKINYALVTYNDLESYIIIGTPVIFITY